MKVLSSTRMRHTITLADISADLSDDTSVVTHAVETNTEGLILIDHITATVETDPDGIAFPLTFVATGAST